jgi:uncharacterized protein (DUF488 family)
VKLYTIGHNNVALHEFLQALQQHEISTLIDIRSKPRSRWAHFNGSALEAALRAEGINYRYMGDRLGGMPRDPAAASAWKRGKLDASIIKRLRSTDLWQQGIAELAAVLEGASDRLCIVCSEGDPAKCHRSAVVEDVRAALPALDIEHPTVRQAQPATKGQIRFL